MLTFRETLIVAAATAVTTLIVNIIFHWFKNKFNWFDENKRFKREYSYKQLENLYLYLYAIICQSEYLRYFHDLEEDFNKVPFLEIESKKYKKEINFGNGTFKSEEFNVKDAISEFNKKKMSQLIIDNAKYSSEFLLKLAVAYRYVNEHYTDKTIEKDLLEKFQCQELKIVSEIVRVIVKETNKKLKTCNMDYNKSEMRKGIIDNTIYKSS